jgi:hypothetical protein
LQRGLRTPEEEYRLPILQALVQLGGKSTPNKILDQVGEIMRDTLNQYDKEHLTSTPSLARWRNTAHWTRNSLVNEGLLSKDSPKGIWEITEAGRQAISTPAPDTQLNETSLSKKDIPTALYHVLKVYEYVVNDKLSYNEAAAKIAREENLKSIHTVYDACTRRINLNTKQFRALLQKHLQLLDHLTAQYPEQERYIRNTIIK